MTHTYIVLLLATVLIACFLISLWLLFRPKKTDEFEDLRVAFCDLQIAVGKEIEPIFRKLNDGLSRLMKGRQ